MYNIFTFLHFPCASVWYLFLENITYFFIIKHFIIHVRFLAPKTLKFSLSKTFPQQWGFPVTMKRCCFSTLAIFHALAVKRSGNCWQEEGFVLRSPVAEVICRPGGWWSGFLTYQRPLGGHAVKASVNVVQVHTLPAVTTSPHLLFVVRTGDCRLM